MYSTHTTVVCRLIKSTILMLFLFNVKCSQIFHLHFYVHMYFRKSVRISKIHLQCSSSVWENINIKFKSKYPVPTIKLAQKNVLKSVESTWVLLSRINQTIRVNWTSNLGQFYKKSKSHVLTNNSINIKLY